MEILFTFAGNRDPFNTEAVEGNFTYGPVLTLLEEKQFQLIYIFTTPNTLINAQNLQQEIAARNHANRIKIFNIDIPDPTDYEELYLHMYKRCQEIIAEHEGQKPKYYIATASGTPQMQTVWFLLSQSAVRISSFHTSQDNATTIFKTTAKGGFRNQIIPGEIPQYILADTKRP